MLHRSIEDGDSYAATFLIKQGADMKTITNDCNETTLHLAASFQ